MIETGQWILLAMIGLPIAALLSFWTSDRYFGTSFFEGHVKKKEVDFLMRQPRWKREILRLFLMTIIVSFAALWPAPVLGAQFLDETLPWLLVFWGFIALASLGEVYFRNEKSEAGLESERDGTQSMNLR